MRGSGSGVAIEKSTGGFSGSGSMHDSGSSITIEGSGDGVSSVEENKDICVNNENLPPPLESNTPKQKSRVENSLEINTSVAPATYVIKKILGHRTSMFGATNASNVQEASSASNRQMNAGRGKYKRHNGVDYLVEWEEEYEGQWGKQKKQWVRDVDIVTPQIIEQYKQSQSLMENKDTDDKYEDDVRIEDEDEYKETEITHT
jgi:hypothetical protein